jgi:hypothetical protein
MIRGRVGKEGVGRYGKEMAWLATVPNNDVWSLLFVTGDRVYFSLLPLITLNDQYERATCLRLLTFHISNTRQSPHLLTSFQTHTRLYSRLSAASSAPEHTLILGDQALFPIPLISFCSLRRPLKRVSLSLPFHGAPSPQQANKARHQATVVMHTQYHEIGV